MHIHIHILDMNGVSRVVCMWVQRMCVLVQALCFVMSVLDTVLPKTLIIPRSPPELLSDAQRIAERI